MVLEFHKLEYHGKLNFTKLEYPKSDRSLYISEIVVDCNIVFENVLFGYFHPLIISCLNHVSRNKSKERCGIEIV